MQYMNNRQTSSGRNNGRLLKIFSVIFLLGLLVVGFYVWKPNNTNVATEGEIVAGKKDKAATPKEDLSLPNIQPVIDQFIESNPGTYAIKVTDLSGKSLAEVKGDKQFFAASIYKLYVAYVGYQKIDDGTFSFEDPYLSGYTRGRCLDAMIRDSYSPCAEKMWDELGKEELTNDMKLLGLTNTSLTGLTTSANDAAIILKKIVTGEGLSEKSQNAYLDSMKEQDPKYRRGLPSGFKQSIVYNKVGWNLDQEWHDTAIVELANKKKVIVSVFTDGVGYKKIATLGAKMEDSLK